jgi:protein-tyrosine-phosphatase
MMRVLVVCTGNICRSPIAAGLLTAGSRVVGLDMQVASAGLIPGGRTADPHSVAVMADRGMDISHHRSHLLTPIDLDVADLVLTMTQEHVVEIGAAHPDALSKTFTIKEFVRLASESGPLVSVDEVADYLEALDTQQRRKKLLRRDPGDDVADPIGTGRRSFARTGDELEALVWSVLDLLAGFPPRPADSP